MIEGIIGTIAGLIAVVVCIILGIKEDLFSIGGFICYIIYCAGLFALWFIFWGARMNWITF